MERVFSNILLALPLVGATSLFALGIVLVYRSSRVLNLAHGAMATLPAYLAYAVHQAGMPAWIALLVGVASGVLLGILVERVIIRLLPDEISRTVGTVAVLGVLVALIAKVWGTAPLRAPQVFPARTFAVGRSNLQLGEIGLTIVAIVIAIVLTRWLRSSDLGLAMRGSAENPRAAGLMGIDPSRMATIAWGLGGGLAAVAGILLASVTSLHPTTLSRQVLPAFVAALLGGLDRMTGALAGAVVVGGVLGLVPTLGSFGEQPGASQLVLTALVLLVMARRGQRFVAGGSQRAASRSRVAARRLSARATMLIAIGVAALPWLPIPRSIVADATLAALLTIVAVSIVILTGSVGQLSLAQASIVGVGAFTTGMLARGGVGFPLSLPIAAVAATAVAVALGAVALRVRGLYLAVATLIFGWMCDTFLFSQGWFVGIGGTASIGRVVIGRDGAFPSIDLTDPRWVFLITAALAGVVLLIASNLRTSTTGRAFAAVRGSEFAAASLGIDVVRTKLLAFGISGLFAGAAGALFIVRGTVTPDQFEFSDSLAFLAIAVVGGLTRLGGVVAASILFAALEELFFRVSALSGLLELTSSLLLLGAVLATAPSIRERLRSRPRAPGSGIAFEPALIDEKLPPPRAHDYPLLMVEQVTVRFGGLVAAEDVSFEVRAGEILALIGPNGAGKTTVFNAISGLNQPTAGRVFLDLIDVAGSDAAARARRGLGRTFQTPQLFADATVAENLLVATHLEARTGPFAHAFQTDGAIADERALRARVASVLRATALDDVKDRRCGDLPFGLLRLVEIARVMVADARVVLLDEPASGLDDLETERLAALLRAMRDRGLAIVLVEHDIAFVASLADQVVVLDRGSVMARGTPAEVRRDPAVIAAYLGTGATVPQGV